MKFTVQQKHMTQALAQITGVLERNQTRDVLSHARVTVNEQGDMQVSCTDLTMTMFAQLKVDQVEEPGGASIPGLRLFSLFRALPEDNAVTLETSEGMVEIRVGRSIHKLKLMTGPDTDVLDSYMPEPPEDHIVVTLPAARLREQLLYTNPVMGMREARPYMVSTCFELTNSYIRTVATEASVLAMATSSGGVPSLNNEDGESDMRQFVVPRKAVLQATSMCATAQRDDMVQLTFGSNHFSTQVGMYTLRSNLMDVKYPEYQKVFPEDLGWSMVCNREALRRAMEEVEVVAADVSHRVNFEAADGVLSMQSTSTRNDSSVVDVALDSLTATRKLAVNGEKILRIASSVADDKLEFATTQEESKSNIRIIGRKGEGSPESSDTSASAIDVTYLLATMSDR